VVGVVNGVLTCSTCASGSAPDRKQTTCIPCGSGTSYSSAVQDCVCSVANSALVESDSAGVLASSKTCVSCPADHYVTSEDAYTCVPCELPQQFDSSTGECGCTTPSVRPWTPTAADPVPCFIDLSDELSSVYPTVSALAANAFTITYSDITSGATTDPSQNSFPEVDVVSGYFQDNLMTAARRCKYLLDTKECNHLANMCVLALYNLDSLVCQLFQDIVDSKTEVSAYDITGWSNGLPWLYYNGPASLFMDATLISTKYSFDAQSIYSEYTNEFGLTAATYSLNGTFLGLSDLTTQLQLCKVEQGDEKNFLLFGREYSNECTINLETLLGTWEEPLFFDLYLMTDTDTFFPLPVLLENYRDSGLLINAGSISRQLSTVVRRLFLYDNVSGYTTYPDSFPTTSIPDVTRYLASLKLSVMLRSDEVAKIKTPVVTVWYGERSSSTVSTNVKVSFIVSYAMDLTEYFRSENVVLGFIIALSCVSWLTRSFNYLRRRQDPNLDQDFLVNAIVNAGAVFGFWFFLLFIGECLYFWVFYKVQDTVSVVLPEDDELPNIEIFMLMAFIGKLVHVLWLVQKQINYDYMLLDWEKPVLESGKTSVSCWRSILLINELAEIQTQRRASVDMTLIITLCLLQGLNWINTSTRQPDILDLSEGDQSRLLRLAVVFLVYLMVVAIQLIVVSVHQRFGGNPIFNIVDLLSVINVSMIILDESRFAGYYIHGRSLVNFADNDMPNIERAMDEYADANVPYRGLKPAGEVTGGNFGNYWSDKNESENQVYELFLTRDVRKKYDQDFITHVEEHRATAMGPGAMPASALFTPLPPPSNLLFRKYFEITGWFTRFIQAVEAQSVQLVTRRPFLEQLGFAVAPDMMLIGQPLFYHDPHDRWTQSLFLGIESDLIALDMLLVLTIDYYERNLFVAIVITLLVDKIISWYRHYAGSRNLCEKTVIDERLVTTR